MASRKPKGAGRKAAAPRATKGAASAAAPQGGARKAAAKPSATEISAARRRVAPRTASAKAPAFASPKERYLDWNGAPVEALPKRPKEWFVELYSSMRFLRCLDERMLKLQRAGRIGFVGSMLGSEACLVGAAKAIGPRDWLWSGLREGGAALLRGLPLSEYIAQMYCNSLDTAKGRQMCNHFQHKGSHYPSWSSVIGTQIPHGVGAAYAAKVRGLDEVHTIFFGDGATSSNGFHSGMNFAAVWKVPAVFVCVNNGWAISVPARAQTASATYAEKAAAYGMTGVRVDGNDPIAVHEALAALIKRARAGQGPALLELVTYRMMGHSSSDDPTKYRDPKEVELWTGRDPLPRFAKFLAKKRWLDAAALDRLEAEHNRTIDQEIHVQEAAAPMPLRSLVEDVYAEVPVHLRKQYNEFHRIAERLGEAQPGDGAFPL